MGFKRECTRRRCKEEKRDAAPLVERKSSEALVQAKRTSFGCGMDRWGNPRHQDGDLNENARGGDAKRRREMQPHWVEMNSSGVLVQAKRTSFGRGMDRWGNPRHQDGDLKENARGGRCKEEKRDAAPLEDDELFRGIGTGKEIVHGHGLDCYGYPCLRIGSSKRTHAEEMQLGQDTCITGRGRDAGTTCNKSKICTKRDRWVMIDDISWKRLSRTKVQPLFMYLWSHNIMRYHMRYIT